MDIANSIGRSTFGADSRDSKQCLGFLANFVEEACRSNIGAIVRNFEFAVGSEILLAAALASILVYDIPCSLGVYHAIFANSWLVNKFVSRMRFFGGGCSFAPFRDAFTREMGERFE